MNTVGHDATPFPPRQALLRACFMALLLCTMLLVGCNAVLVEKPMGDVVVTLDPVIWQGTWASDEVVILTTVLDADKGMLQAAWVERGAEGEGARFESVTGTVRQTGDMLFLNMEQETFEEPDKETGASAAPLKVAPNNAELARPRLTWGRITNDGKRTVLWLPDVEQFQQAVQDGRLPGSVTESEDVLLGPLDAAQMELINSPAGNLLNWSEPLVFVRIGD